MQNLGRVGQGNAPRLRLKRALVSISWNTNDHNLIILTFEEENTQNLLPPPPTPAARPSKGKGKAKAIDKSAFLPRVDSPWKIGAHVSAAGGVENAVLNAAMIGCRFPSFTCVPFSS